MDGDSLGMIIIMLILLALSAFFSATETAFSTFNRIKMKSLAQGGDKKAALVLKYDENYDKLLNTVLIGNNIVNIALSSIATLFFVDLLTKYSEQAQSLGATVSTVQGAYPLNVSLPIGTILNISGTQSKQTVSASAKGKSVSGMHYGTVTVVVTTSNRMHNGGTN